MGWKENPVGYETVVILESLLRKALEFQSLQWKNTTPLAAPDMGGTGILEGGTTVLSGKPNRGGTHILRRNPSSGRHVPGGNRNPRRPGPPVSQFILPPYKLSPGVTEGW